MKYMLLALSDKASYVRLCLGHSKANIVPNIKMLSGLHFIGHKVRESRFAKICCGELNER